MLVGLFVIVLGLAALAYSRVFGKGRFRYPAQTDHLRSGVLGRVLLTILGLGVIAIGILTLVGVLHVKK